MNTTEPRKLQSPVGYVIEDRDEGLFLLGDWIGAKSFVQVHEGLWTAERTRLNGMVSVEIGYSPYAHNGIAEWGNGEDPETAWRYALGAHFGSTEDPEIEKEGR